MPFVFIALGVFCLILVPLVPKLLRLRIRILEWLGWTWAVQLIENHFDRWVLFARAVLLTIAVGLFYTSWEALAS